MMSTEATIYNVRHGLTVANVAARGCFDFGDPGLLPIGHEQLYQAGQFSSNLNIGKVVCGPMLRHEESTIDFISGLAHTVEVIIDPDAAELQWDPMLEGLRKKDVFAWQPVANLSKKYGLDMHIGQGESERDVAQRMQRLYARHLEPVVGSLAVITSQTPAKAVQGVVQGQNRLDFCKVAVPQGSVARFDMNDPYIRTPLFIPVQPTS